MAEIAKSGTPSYSSVAPPQSDTIAGFVAGEAIAAGDACYMANTGKVMKATGAAANAAARVLGFAFTDAPLGEAVTLVDRGNFRYGAGLSIGALYFLSGTVAGGLADVASTGGTKAIATVIDATRIRLITGNLGF